MNSNKKKIGLDELLFLIMVLLIPVLLSLIFLEIGLNKIIIILILLLIEISLIVLYYSSIFQKYFNQIKKFLKNKKIILLFWIELLVISFFYLKAHGLFIVSDGYLEQSRVYYYIIFGGEKPSNFAMEIYYQRKFLFRPLYPLLCAIISKPFTYFLSVENSIILIGITITIISSYLSLKFLKKIIFTITGNKKKSEHAIYFVGTIPSFIIFLSKFSTDMIFNLFCVITIYFFTLYKKKREFKNLLYYFLFLLISCFIRELGIFLIFPLISILIKSKNSRIFLNFFGFLIGFLLMLIIFKENLDGWRSLWSHFYTNLYPINNPNFDLQYFDNWVVMLMSELFSLTVFKSIFFTVLWSFGIFALLFTIYPIIKNEKIKKKIGNIRYEINFNSELFSFVIYYSIFIWIMIGKYISERYFIPSGFIFSILFYNNENNSEFNIPYSFVIYNILLLVVRILIIY